MHSKNARANRGQHITRTFLPRAPPSAKLLTYQFALSSLPCLPCNDICVQIIRSGTSQIQPESGPTLQLLRKLSRKQSLLLCFEGKKL